MINQVVANVFDAPDELVEFPPAVSKDEVQDALESLSFNSCKEAEGVLIAEHVKWIKELGMDSDGKDEVIEKFRERVGGLKTPEGVRNVFDEELGKLRGLEPGRM